MNKFGELLRYYRRNSKDPKRGGVLTQERLGVLIGDYLGDMGIAGATISNWERGRFRPQDRKVFLALLHVLHQTGGINSRAKVEEMLVLGGLPILTEAEALHFDAAWLNKHESDIPLIPTESAQEWSRLRHFLPTDLFEQVERAPLEQKQALCLARLKQLLTTIITYVPRHHALALLADPAAPNKQISGEFLEGTLLFADISGFTKLTERLYQVGGKEGAEKIVGIVNQYLDTMLAILFRFNGHLIKFGGDAMLCLFAGKDEAAMNALWAAWEMNQAMSVQFAQIEVFQELFHLDMKVGNNTGLLFATTIGDETHLEYFLTGRAAERTAQAEAAAHRQEIIVSQDTYKQVINRVEMTELPEKTGFYRVTAVPPKPPQENQDIWSMIVEQINNHSTDLWSIIDRLEALSPYLPTGLLPQLAYDPKAEHLESQHRRVTVMFVNFTGMSRIIEIFGPERAEEITAILQEYFQAMQQEAHYYGGVVNKVDLYDQGDKLMVLFGAPVTHERDARRAALTALAMQKRMKKLKSPLAGTFLSQRIGIHTGFVFAGHVGSSTQHRREYTVMGNAVNLAARLMSAAAEDEIRISQAVWDQIQAEFLAELLPSELLPGLDEPVPMYRLTAFSEGAQRPLPHLQAPLIGRQDILEDLKARTNNMLYGGIKQVIAIIGEGGVGKSRLVQSWQEDMETIVSTAKAPLWLTSYARSYGQPTYGLFLDIVRGLVGITGNDEQADCWHKLDRYVGQQLIGSETFTADLLLQRQAYLGSFLGLDMSLRHGMTEWVSQLEGEALQLQIWLAISDLLQVATQERPLILILEDLHWADKDSLALLEFVIDRLPDTVPFIFCLVFRSQKEALIWQTWHNLKKYPDCKEIELKELDEQMRANLLHELLGLERPLDPSFEQLVIDETDGNPLYLEEVLYRLIEDKTLELTETGWQLPHPVTKLAVPDSLYQMIQSRIDHLDYASPGARRVLWLASVLGLTFTSEDLRQIFVRSGRDQAEFQRHFRILRNAAMFRDPVAKVGTDSPPPFKFRHGLVQQVAYENMPTYHRRQYHQEVGQWLEIKHQTAPTGYYETLAHHFAQARVWDKAFHYYSLAGQRDARIYANDSAERYLWMALSLVEQAQPDDSDLAQAYYEFGKVLVVKGEFDTAQRHLVKAFNLFSSLAGATALTPDSKVNLLQARICYEIGHIYQRQTKDLPTALSWQKQGLALLPETPTAEAAMLHALGGMVYLRQGNFQQAQAEAEQSLAQAQATDVKAERSFAHRMLSIVHRARGKLPLALNHCQASIAVSEEISDLIGLGKDYANLGVIAFEMDDWLQAQDAYQQAVTVLEKAGDKFALTRAYANLADLYYHQGNLEDGFHYARLALDMSGEMDARQEMIIAQVILATLHWRMEEWKSAFSYLLLADELAETAVMFKPTVGRWLLEVALSQGDLAQAEQRLAALQTLETDILVDEAEPIQRLQAQFLAAQGEPARAIEILEASLTRLEASGPRYQEAQALLILAKIQTQIQPDKNDVICKQAKRAQTIFTELGARLDADAAAEFVALACSKSIQMGVIRIELAIDFHKFTLEEQNRFVVELSRIANINLDEICIRDVKPGSVSVLLEMPEEAVTVLMKLFFSEGAMKSLEIEKIEVIPPQMGNHIITAPVGEENEDAITTDEHVNLLQLFYFIANHFNESELKEVCFELNVDYESLGGAGKRDNVRELIEYMKRRGRTNELALICQQHRPGVFIDLAM